MALVEIQHEHNPEILGLSNVTSDDTILKQQNDKVKKYYTEYFKSLIKFYMAQEEPTEEEFNQYFRKYLMNAHKTKCNISDDSNTMNLWSESCIGFNSMIVSMVDNLEISDISLYFKGVNNDINKMRFNGIITKGDQYYQIKEIIQGPGIYFSYSCGDDDFKISTKKRNNADNSWDTNKTIKEQFESICSEIGINFSSLKEIMNKPENHKYRICLNLIISDKETTFYDKSFITLVSAYLIDKEQNPMNLIREELNEYKAGVIADNKYVNRELYTSIETKMQEANPRYIIPLKIDEFKNLLYNIGLFGLEYQKSYQLITGNAHVDGWETPNYIEEIRRFVDTCPHYMTGFNIINNNMEIMEVCSQEYIKGTNFHPGRSIEIKGDSQDDNFLISNFNVFILMLKFMMIKNQNHSEDEQINKEIMEKVCSDFDKYYGFKKFQPLFNMFTIKIKEFSKILFKYYQGNHMCKGTENYVEEKDFPNCLRYEYGQKHLIFQIHGAYLKIRNSKTNHKFKMTQDYIFKEILIKQWLPKFLQDIETFKDYELHYKGIYGNLFKSIMEPDMRIQIRPTNHPLTEEDIFGPQ